MAPGQTGIKEKTNQKTPPTRKLKDSPPGRVSYHIARKELAAITKKKKKKKRAGVERQRERKKEMTTIRRFCCNDLLRFTSVNLDHLTETVTSSFFTGFFF